MLALLVAEEGAHHENNFWYGDLNEVIWGTLSFLILLGAFLKWGLPAIRKFMAEHRQGIADQISEGEQRRSVAEQQLTEIQSQLSDSDAETQRILVEAREAAQHLKVDLAQRAEQDVVELQHRVESESREGVLTAVGELAGRTRESLGYTATWVKGKYYENKFMGALMDAMNNIPLP